MYDQKRCQGKDARLPDMCSAAISLEQAAAAIQSRPICYDSCMKSRIQVHSFRSHSGLLNTTIL